MRSDSRPGRLLAAVNSVHVSRHETGAGLGEDGPPPEENSSLSSPLLPLFEDILGANWQSHDHSIHSSQRGKKKSLSPAILA